ncbi:MAG: tetratricopeptide repeat protein [Nitrospiraceae bacterium]|nr:tetratricopeptide repeat protein [Nitrospiraceae bacterium]
MKNRKAILLLLVLAGTVYANSLFSGFVWDDNSLIIKKSAFFSHPENVLKIFMSSDSGLGQKNPYYRPFNIVTYMADHYLWGLNPFWYHLENVLLHALVVILFYLVVMKVFEDKRLAFISALFFAVYPVNAEAVDAVFNRNVLFCAAFSLASLLFLAKGKPKWTALSFLSYFLALLSKEPSVVLPFFLLSLRLTAKEEKFKAKWNVLAMFFGITALYFLIRHFVLGVFTSGSGMELSPERLKLMAAVLFEHLRLMLFPFHLNALYYEGDISFTLFKVMVTITGILLLLYLSLKKKTPDPVRAGAQWILWGLIPVSGIVRIPSAPVAERYQYTVIFGFVLILGYLLAGLQKRKMLGGPVIAFALALVLGARTFTRNFVWHDNLSLYSSMVSSDPWNPIARSYLGLYYEKHGALEKAAQECRVSKKIDPLDGDAYICMGLIYAKQGRPEESFESFQKAVQVAPGYYKSHMDLAVAYMKENRVADAESEFRETTVLNPGYSDAHMNLAELYLKQDRMKEAENEFQAVIKLDPDNARAHADAGLVYAGQGDLDGAVREFKTALAIDPLLIDTVMNLGVAYAKEGLFEGAEQEFQTALKLSPANAQARAFLNAAESRLNNL